MYQVLQYLSESLAIPPYQDHVAAVFQGDDRRKTELERKRVPEQIPVHQVVTLRNEV